MSDTAKTFVPYDIRPLTRQEVVNEMLNFLDFHGLDASVDETKVTNEQLQKFVNDDLRAELQEGDDYSAADAYETLLEYVKSLPAVTVKDE